MKKSLVYFSKWFLLPIIEFFFLDSISGRENIPKDEGFIIAANHNTSLDHFLIACAFKEKLQKIHFVGKREGVNGILRLPLDYFAQTITFNPRKFRREEILEKMASAIKNGKILVIYPEGDTNRKSILLRGKTGVAEVLMKTQTFVLPVGIARAGKIKWKIKIGKPLFWKKFKDLANLQKITDQIMKEIAKLADKTYPYED